MPFTMAGWFENVAAATTQQAITAIADEHLHVEGDNIVVPSLNKLLGYYAIGLDIQNAELSSPQLRRTALINIAPVENTDLPTFPPDIIARPNNPVTLEEDEQLLARVGNSNAGAQDECLFAILSDGPVMGVSGDIFTVLATATAPAVANTWQNAALTLTQDLPAGMYDVVGCRCEQATTRVFRLVFIEGRWRPGTVACIAINSKDIAFSRYGGMGVWGSFKHTQPPSVDFMGDGTGGAARLYLDIIKRT